VRSLDPLIVHPVSSVRLSCSRSRSIEIAREMRDTDNKHAAGHAISRLKSEHTCLMCNGPCMSCLRGASRLLVPFPMLLVHDNLLLQPLVGGFPACVITIILLRTGYSIHPLVKPARDRNS